MKHVLYRVLVYKAARGAVGLSAWLLAAHTFLPWRDLA